MAAAVPWVGVAETAAAALEALDGGEPVVGVVVLETGTLLGKAGASTPPGRRLLVRAGRTDGTLGDAVLDIRAAELAREVLETGAAAVTRTVEIDEQTHLLYLEPYRPPPELVIVGAGHIARPLCRIGAMLGFRVTVLDDRPEFATRERFPEAARVIRADFGDPFRDVPLRRSTHLVLVTRGHKYDYDALSDVLWRSIQPAYIGMVGSRRRVRAALEQLARDGINRERLLPIHAPIGLDIGAETPEEIAVAIAAELVRLRRGGTGDPLRDRDRVVERWIGKRG
ncbi:MAG: XdhC family protein [Gemmatimonadetes bacterium]|nr:XdhC family protein [Gemmatimonadota bacterium]